MDNLIDMGCEFKDLLFENKKNKTMNKKEFKVGEIFQCGLITLKCEKNDDTGLCDKCYFLNKDDCMDFFDLIGSCHSSKREDNTDVVFVKVED